MKPTSHRRAPASRRSPLTTLLFCVTAIALSFVGAGYLAARFAPTLFAPIFAQHYASIENDALNTPADHERLMGIGTALHNHLPVSDTDLNWAIALLQRGPVVDTPFTRNSFTLRALSQLINRGSLTTAQCHRIAIAVLPYAADPPPAERAPDAVGDPSPQVTLQQTALLVLSKLDDKAATDKLETLAQNSPTPLVRQTARNLLNRRNRNVILSHPGD